MKTKYLIINADGFGFTFGNNRAIFETAQNGSISSISVTPNFPAIAELPIFHRQFPDISIGVHLNPVVGTPISHPDRIPTLLAPDGEFWGDEFPIRLRKGQIKSRALFRELMAQVQFVSDMGIPITHIDSHQNQHLRPGYFEVFLDIAKSTRIKRMRTHRHYICAECGSPKSSTVKYYTGHLYTFMIHTYTRWLMTRAKRAGMKMADRLLSVGHYTQAKKTSMEVWRKIIGNVPPGISEVYCHPGYPDDTLRRYARYVEERAGERKVLVSSRFKQLLEVNNVTLIGFQNV